MPEWVVITPRWLNKTTLSCKPPYISNYVNTFKVWWGSYFITTLTYEFVWDSKFPKAETFYKESVARPLRTCPWLFHQLSSKTYLTSLAYQTTPIRPECYSNVCKMATPAGFEPATSCVTGKRSSLLNYGAIWSSRQESNLQPTDYKSVALPIAPREHIIGWLGGFNSTPKVYYIQYVCLAYQA